MITYLSSQGDTWDYIAFKHYSLTRREFMMSDLLNSNPQFCHYVILPANLTILIPDPVIPDSSKLPPWVSS